MPMNPEWLPVLAILLAGIGALILALRALFSMQLRKGLALGVLSLAMIALALALGRPTLPHDRIVPLTAGKASAPRADEEPDSNATSLVLGAVVLRVPDSNRYDLSLNGRKFLALERSRKGLLVSCDAGSPEDGFVVHIRRNRFVYPSWPLGHPNRPDEQTFALQNDAGKDVFRVRYADPHRIEVMGVFYTSSDKDTMEIRDRGGIHWPGGGAPRGMMVDLRHFGKGSIDFERTGLICVRR